MTVGSRIPGLTSLSAVSLAAVAWSLSVTTQDGLTRVRLMPHYADPDVAARVLRFARRSGTLTDWPDGAIAKIVEGRHTSELSSASRAALLSDGPAAPPDWWRP